MDIDDVDFTELNDELDNFSFPEITDDLDSVKYPDITDIVLPEGPAGPQGPAGPEGPQGPRGPEGPQGPEGPAGLQGPQGIRGEQGLQGDRGLQGPTGDQGPIGEQGPEGEAGDQGPMGEIGLQGPAGDAGEFLDEHIDALKDDVVLSLIADDMLVEEHGSNADGSWVKFTNGLAICYFMKAIEIDLPANTDYQVNEIPFPLTLSTTYPLYCVTTPYLYKSESSAVYETQYKTIATAYAAGKGRSWGWLKCWHTNTTYNATALRLYCLMIGMVT